MKQKQSIGSRLKQYRLEHDLTFAQLAKDTGIKAPTLYRIENELVEPNERTLYRLQKAIPELVGAA